MNKILPYISLVGIILAIAYLFPGVRSAFSDLLLDAEEKKNHVVEEYEGVKSDVVEVTNTVTETKESIDQTVDKVQETKEKIDGFLDFN